MKKEFNVTGTCRAPKHYMADVSNKLEQTLEMVEKPMVAVLKSNITSGIIHITTLKSMIEMASTLDPWIR